MKLLKQPIHKALDILKRDNPRSEFHATAHGIWGRIKAGTGRWQCLVSEDMDGTVRVFEPGEKTIAVDPHVFNKYFK